MKKALLLFLGVSLFSSGSLAGQKILARVNGKPITESDLNWLMSTLPPNYQTLKNNPQFRKRLLESLINEKILYQEALKEGIENDEEVRKEVERLKEKVIVRALIRRHVKPLKVKVTDAEARAFYEKNKGKFKDANGKIVSFSLVKPFILQSLQRQKEQKAFEDAFNDYLSNLKKKYKIKVYYK